MSSMKRGEYMKIDIRKLKIAQVKSCLSVNELVDKTGLSRATVSKIFNGINEPSAKSAGLLAKALNIDPTEILSREQ